MNVLDDDRRFHEKDGGKEYRSTPSEANIVREEEKEKINKKIKKLDSLESMILFPSSSCVLVSCMSKLPDRAQIIDASPGDHRQTFKSLNVELDAIYCSGGRKKIIARRAHRQRLAPELLVAFLQQLPFPT